MALPALESAPVLSTPDTHIFDDPTPVVDTSLLVKLSDEQLVLTYEIERTVREIRAGRWKRIALQFPDHMLTDGPRVFGQLSRELGKARKTQHGGSLTDKFAAASLQHDQHDQDNQGEQLFILGDTSYGACCVDEVAAEHVDADVVVHYGRSCLSPPSRLPVIYVFTERPLDLDTVVSTFKQTYPARDSKVILMADIPYAHHVPLLHARLLDQGYTNIFATSILHNPSSLLPNRTVPQEASEARGSLRDYALFHISDPPTALLLTLSSRVASIHIYPTTTEATTTPAISLANTAQSLGRRYALLTSLSTTPIFGILINTLSVKNYMHILSHVQRQIADAGKKSYTFVVGKVNAAKVANFSEVGGWVVIGCWESSLIESRDFWRPMITPWELKIALQGDDERVWTGDWEPDFEAVLHEKTDEKVDESVANGGSREAAPLNADLDDYESEEESAPPEFDLRTGRYVSHSRPMRAPASRREPQPMRNGQPSPASTAVTKRAIGDLASVGGVVSPGAEFLRSNRTWQGLGSDYQNDEERHPSVGIQAAKMEEGRSGIARGYVVGEDGGKH
jgi:diphthamide biosynthesis protein 2